MTAILVVCHLFAIYMLALTIDGAFTLYAPFMVVTLVVGIVLWLVSRSLRKQGKVRTLEKITGFVSAGCYTLMLVWMWLQFGLFSWATLVVPVTVLLFVCGMGLMPRRQNINGYKDHTGIRCLSWLPILFPLALATYTYDTPLYAPYLFAAVVAGFLTTAFVTTRIPSDI